MKRSYSWFWLLFFTGLVSGITWAQCGQAWFRKHYNLPAPVPEAARTQQHFLALVFPRISAQSGPFTVCQADFEAILKGLQTLGYTPIGLDDVADFYIRRRLLPPRAVLIALDRDEPQSVSLGDESLRRLRLRGVIFLAGGEARTGRAKRHWLSRHAIAQMRNSGAWDFGTSVTKDPGSPAQEFAFSNRDGDFLFVAALTGFNDDRNASTALNILRVRPNRPAAETVRIIHSDQPRQREFVDEFASRRPGLQWVSEWGAASTASHRLLLLPTPHETGATIFLRGTDSWRDMAVEFQLRRVTKNFWAYVRYKDSDHFVRFGATEEGFWQLQQKRGPFSPPALLGRVLRRPGAFPARVRVVVKGDSALLFVNGAMQFGKPVRFDPGIDRGRVQLGVYDKEFKAARVEVESFRARPLGTKWVALMTDGLSRPFVEERLRAEAVEARAISPSWVTVAAGGAISSDVRERETVWSFAGFYRCRLVPLVDMSSWVPNPRGGAAAAERLASGLAESARVLEGDGLNVLLPAGAGGAAAGLLEALGAKLRAQKRELWVTSEGVPDPSWSRAVDGVLRPVARPVSGLDLLEAFTPGPAPTLAVSGPEVASWR